MYYVLLLDQRTLTRRLGRSLALPTNCTLRACSLIVDGEHIEHFPPVSPEKRKRTQLIDLNSGSFNVRLHSWLVAPAFVPVVRFQLCADFSKTRKLIVEVHVFPHFVLL